MLKLIQSRQNQAFDIRKPGPGGFDQFQPVHTRHADIRQQKIRNLLLHPDQCLLPVFGTAQELYPQITPGNGALQRQADQLHIFSDQ
ncbi:hypothetical protein D3C76_1534080 [compost metagenome]